MKNIILILTMLIPCFFVKAQCIDGNCNNGVGTYETYEFIYKGDWKDGMKDGKGIYTEKKANREYGGDWVKGKKNGEGAEIDYLGVCYIGHWENNERKGEGVLLYKNGYYKKGIFPDNLKYYTNENVEIAENEFTKITDLEILNRTGYGCIGDCKNGTGTYTWFNWGDKCTYTGQWKNGLKNGEGTLIKDNGYSYTGHWKNDWQDGQGAEISDYTMGEKYEGKFGGAGSHKGKGILTKPNGYYVKAIFDFIPHSKKKYYTNENIEIDWREFEEKTSPCSYTFEGNCFKGLGVCEYRYFTPDINDTRYHLGYWNDRKKEGFGIDYTKTRIKQYGLWKNDTLIKTLTQNEAQKYLDADPIISDQMMYVYSDIAKTARDEEMDALQHKMRMEEIARKEAKRNARNAEWAGFNRTLQIMNSASSSNTTTTSSSSSKSNTSSSSNSSYGNGTGTTKMPDIIYKTVGGSGTTIYTHKQ